MSIGGVQKKGIPQMAIEKWGAQLRLATEFVIQANWAAPQLQMNCEPPSFLMGKPMVLGPPQFDINF